MHVHPVSLSHLSSPRVLPAKDDVVNRDAASRDDRTREAWSARRGETAKGTVKGTARVQNKLHEVTNEAHDNEAKAGALCNFA